MRLLSQVTNNPLQQQTLVLDDGSSVLIQLYLRPQQSGWFFNTIVWNTFVLNGLRVSNSPNMLYQFSNQIPFGLACYSTANREPSQQDDFISGASKLYLLDEAEVAAYVAFLRNGG